MTADTRLAAASHTPHRVVPYDHARHGDGPWHVVKTVFDEYGFEFEVGDYDADVATPHLYYDGTRGWFWVAEDASGRVVGCIGLTNEGEGAFELHRLYVLPEARRTGLGRALVDLVIREATARGGQRLILFSDIHLRDAHRLYERIGFRCVRFRYAPDPWQSREWGYTLPLATPPRTAEPASRRTGEESGP